MLKFLLLILISLSLAGSGLVAQQDSIRRAFDQESLDSLKQLKEYDYNRVIEEPDFSFLNWLGESILSLIRFFGTTSGVIVLCLLLIIILFFAFKNRLIGKKKVPRPKEEILPIIIETDNSFAELTESLKQALLESNYRLAIRFQFIIIIKLLEKQKLINYHNEKTNQDLIAEIPNKYKNEFRLITRIFDYAWYGNATVDQDMFQVVEDFSKKIKGGENVA